MIKIVVGSDHGGYDLKDALVKFLKSEKYTVKDLGTHSKESCDYPLIGFEVAKEVSDGKADRGVLVCTSGIGMAIIANKVKGVRAVACYDNSMAQSSREHNDTNVIVFGARYTGAKEAGEMLKTWLSTPHLGERHARRVKQIKDIETKEKKNLHGKS